MGVGPEAPEDSVQGGSSWNSEKAEVDANEVVLVLFEVGKRWAIGKGAAGLVETKKRYQRSRRHGR